jgi:hypothetical protein
MEALEVEDDLLRHHSPMILGVMNTTTSVSSMVWMVWLKK